MSVKIDKKEKPHYHGHRDRLRERFAETGGDNMPDYELLELLLFQAIPRKDVKPLAKKLLVDFDGLVGVLSSSVNDLVEKGGISFTAAVGLKSVQAAAIRLGQRKIEQRPVISAWNDLMTYCHSVMAHEKNEQFRILFLNPKNVLIKDEKQQTGTVNHTPVYPREVIKRALELGATALILVHNHPSGDPAPSRDDIAMTEKIVTAGDAVGITVHDHVIIGKEDSFSMKSTGLI
jgi:DNA repair protein RadC